MRAGLSATVHTSVILHLLGLTAMSLLSGWLRVPPPPLPLVTTELLVAPPEPVVSEPAVEPEPPPPLPEPEPLPAAPEPVPAPPAPPVTPPKLITKPLPERVTPRAKPTPVVQRVRMPAPAHPRPPAPSAAPAPGPVAAGPAPGAAVERLSEAAPAPAAEGSAAGAGQLFDRGDVGVVPGAGASGGGGGTGRSGLGTGGVGATGTARTASVSSDAGDNSLARPLGGYQVKPRYPEVARRQGVQGTTLLKVHVNASGLVEDVRVEHSAGHSELDVAAMEAVKQWKFEPARQGRQPVAVWVMLPVRFTLR